MLWNLLALNVSPRMADSSALTRGWRISWLLGITGLKKENNYPLAGLAFDQGNDFEIRDGILNVVSIQPAFFPEKIGDSRPQFLIR
jgi:hypothetical protein